MNYTWIFDVVKGSKSKSLKKFSQSSGPPPRRSGVAFRFPSSRLPYGPGRRPERPERSRTACVRLRPSPPSFTPHDVRTQPGSAPPSFLPVPPVAPSASTESARRAVNCPRGARHGMFGTKASEAPDAVAHAVEVRRRVPVRSRSEFERISNGFCERLAYEKPPVRRSGAFAIDSHDRTQSPIGASSRVR